MRRQLLTPLLWLLVLLVVGTVEFLRAMLRIVAALRFKGVLTLATLVVLWRSDTPLAAEFSVQVVGPLGHMIAVAVALAVAVAVLYHGLRSSMRRRLWRRLRSRMRPRG